MKLCAPKYFTEFSCIADRCHHSCCVGWEIDIDPETAEKYRTLALPYGDAVRKSLAEGESLHFRLAADERCPHLDARGLCRIIQNCGETYLCDICREHPRFYHETSCGREVGIGMACEEACRLILTSDAFAEFVPVGEAAGEPEATEFDAVAHRTHVYALLSDRSLPYAERRARIGAEYGVLLNDLSDEAAREMLSELEYLDPAHREDFLAYSSTCADTEVTDALARALAYFVFRHCSAAQNMAAFCEGLGFALFCERLIASIAPGRDLAACARIVSEELEYSEENTWRIKLEFAFL